MSFDHYVQHLLHILLLALFSRSLDSLSRTWQFHSCFYRVQNLNGFLEIQVHKKTVHGGLQAYV